MFVSFLEGCWKDLSLPELDGPLTPSGLYRVGERRGMIGGEEGVDLIP